MKNSTVLALLSKNDSKNRIENPEYISSQLITYLGNKRALLDFIGTAVEIVQEKLVRERFRIFDVFSGSGVVSRYFRQFSSLLVANDLETYATVINKCYLSNAEDRDIVQLRGLYCGLKAELEECEMCENWTQGIISANYAPKNDLNIQSNERVFYTTRNAGYIDTALNIIYSYPEDIRPFFLAPLLAEASVHANTSGVFKGFYKNPDTGLGQFGGKNKNALSRITGNIDIPFPVFSEYNCETVLLQGDANQIIKTAPEVDLAYVDPPYNQHPYGSNYFMLNVIANNKLEGKMSPVSGIPENWNRSAYNKQKEVEEAFTTLISDLSAKFVLVSFNSEGFITSEKIQEILNKFGEVTILETDYNAFRGSRNLSGRSLYVKEYLFLLEKTDK
jgi:adenine-specific DNA-methyltransferase